MSASHMAPQASRNGIVTGTIADQAGVEPHERVIVGQAPLHGAAASQKQTGSRNRRGHVIVKVPGGHPVSRHERSQRHVPM